MYSVEIWYRYGIGVWFCELLLASSSCFLSRTIIKPMPPETIFELEGLGYLITITASSLTAMGILDYKMLLVGISLMVSVAIGIHGGHSTTVKLISLGQNSRHFDRRQLQMQFLFSLTKVIEFQFEFNWNLFPGVQLSITTTGSGNGLVPNRP